MEQWIVELTGKIDKLTFDIGNISKAISDYFANFGEKFSPDKLLIKFVSWAWSWVHPTAYWVCCCGLVICILMYIVSKSRKCVYNATKFGFVLFAVEAVDAACRGV